MQQTGSTIAEAWVITEAVLPDRERSSDSIQRFVAVISNSFSGLLTAEKPTTSDELSDDQEESYQVGLTFDPVEIADFLTRLSGRLKSTVEQETLIKALPLLQPNDPTRQSEFTLRLVEVLSAASTVLPLEVGEEACDRFVAAALQQQIEQERLLNEVAVKIRESLNLPELLNTAVSQVRQLLQADRVIIYEFNSEAVSTLLQRSEQTQSINQASVYGQITYEARAAESIPMVLGMEEGMRCFSDLLSHHKKYAEGAIEAIDDVVEATFAISPCLLKLLRRASVRAKMMVPILVRNQPWGLMIAHQTLPRNWQDYEKIFFQRIAEHLAIAIYQTNLYTQLQQQKEMLEQRVAERTRDLDDALVAAQAANRAKGEFLAAMSHELRTPLTCVIGMADTLLRSMSQKPDTYSLKPEKQLDYLGIIKKSGEHLLEVINDILDVSQVESGKAVLSISPFSLSQLAHQCLQMIREKAISNGVELVMDLYFPPAEDEPSQDAIFVADRRRVSQILLNLLSNAVKFTPEGGRVTLRIWTDRDSAIFQVVDTGIGIAPSQKPLLFQKFQQLDSVYHRKYEGTGLGLALTKQLVELHGGTIEVDSTVGVGSTFTVRLPAQSLTASQSKSVQGFSENGTAELNRTLRGTAPPNLAGRIVLIEHHEETAMLICDLLTAAGCQVVWMVDGSTAIKQIEVLQPTLVITDIQLPGMDGFEVMRYLRSHPILQKTKILALTPHNLSGEQEKWLTERANDYLVKPLQPYQLLDTVEDLVRRSGAA
jgi:two-component system sensor histidine kinase/response regulator